MAQRILLMYDFLKQNDIGGIENLMATHAHMLIAAGFKVKLLFGDMDPNATKNEIYQGLELEEYGSKKLLGPLKLLGGIIGINNLKQIIQPNDIIISYSSPINITLRKYNNIKINFINHTPNFLYLPIKERWKWANNLTRKIAFIYSIFLGPITRYFDKKSVKANSLIFVNSEFTKKKIQPIYNTEMIVSYPPVNSMFKPSISNNTLLKYNITIPYLFSSGRLIPDKRFDLLLNAYTKSKQKIPLIISGKGTELNNLLSLTEKLKINNKVRFIGFVTTEELLNLYSSATAYLMPTPTEDYGLTTAETLTCGCPIIVWNDNGGSCEQCIDKVNGYKAIPYDTLDMAKKIDLCIDSNFKANHQQEILNSAKKFSEEGQKDIFIRNIKKLLLNSNSQHI